MKRRLPCLVLVVGCNSEPSSAAPEPAGTCGFIEQFQTLPSPHSDDVDPAAWNSNPPTSGPHSPAWAGWNRAYENLPRVHWVHNLEHGGVVLAYRCDEPCPDVVQGLKDVILATPDDEACAAPVHHRLLLVHDPALPVDVQVAAVAWGVHYTATCLDAPTMAEFIADHYDRAPESFCGDGGAFDGEPLY
ncbi:MAG: DUF3105 domain-containing protein [Myxococcales bacterium]|nr:DUF3105 domain-containing protein [Myxococcales bacterium]